MKKIVFFVMSIVLIVLLCSVSAMAIEIKDLIYCTDIPEKYEEIEPVSNHFVHGDRFAIIVPFGGIILIEEPERKVEIETFTTLVLPNGIKIYNSVSSGLLTRASPEFDPNRAFYYQFINALPWMPIGEYTVTVRICDYLNGTEDSITSTFYIHALPGDC